MSTAFLAVISPLSKAMKSMSALATNATNMNVATAHMSLMNDAKISTINISESLTGYLTSGSKLYYKGTPAEMDIQVSDGAELIKCD